MPRTIVIGDIHGCFDELVSLLESVRLDASDRVVAVGDLTVKGNKSREVLDLFISDARFSSVLGNHDLALVRFWRGETITLKQAQKRTYDQLQPEVSRYCEYLDSLPFMINLGSHVVVHAGVRPGIALAEQSREDLTELRTLGPDRTRREGVPWYEVYDQEKVVLFGHWPASEPRRGRSALGLDTGCVYGGRLTAYLIETGDLISVVAQKVYDPPRVQFKPA